MLDLGLPYSIGWDQGIGGHAVRGVVVLGGDRGVVGEEALMAFERISGESAVEEDIIVR